MDKESRRLQVGDLVIIRDKNAPRNSWPLALVDDLKLSKDGLVRSAYLLQGRGTKRRVWRAVTDLVILASADELSKSAT